MARVEYDSNNSGGVWWLRDHHWKTLEANGWVIHWLADDEHYATRVNKDGRWLGALAMKASLHDATIREAIDSFQLHTDQTASELGCGCCGSPHSFTLYDDEDKYVESYYPDSPSHGSEYTGD